MSLHYIFLAAYYFVFVYAPVFSGGFSEGSATSRQAMLTLPTSPALPILVNLAGLTNLLTLPALPTCFIRPFVNTRLLLPGAGVL